MNGITIHCIIILFVSFWLVVIHSQISDVDEHVKEIKKFLERNLFDNEEEEENYYKKFMK